MRKYLNILAISGALFLASCMGKQNQAPNEGMNLDSERIYGVRGAEPRQLKNKYPDPTEETLNKIEKIQNKLYPKPAKTEEVAMAVDSTATN